MLLRRGWRVVHGAAPAFAERIDDRRRARFRAVAAVDGIVRFEERIAALERDLDLVSKQLAVVTMRLEHPHEERSGGASAAGAGSSGEGEEERILKSRLSAIAFYEERISRLEAAAGISGPDGSSRSR